MGDLLKLVSMWSTGLGPYFSGKDFPPMATSLREWAYWVSFIAASGAWMLATKKTKKVTTGTGTPATAVSSNRWIIGGVASAVICALAYMAMNELWTSLSGTWTDTAWRVALVAVYSLGCAGFTAAAAAAANTSA